MTAWVAVGIAGVGCAYGFAHFLLVSPEISLIHPEQVELSGNSNVSRARVLDIFRADRGHSVLRIPLDERRRQLESIPWIEQATVRRALPHTIQVEIAERTPIAFLREGSEMSLVDVHGVILDRPLQGKFHFPVVTGMNSGMPADEQEPNAAPSGSGAGGAVLVDPIGYLEIGARGTEFKPIVPPYPGALFLLAGGVTAALVLRGIAKLIRR